MRRVKKRQISTGRRLSCQYVSCLFVCTLLRLYDRSWPHKREGHSVRRRFYGKKNCVVIGQTEKRQRISRKTDVVKN